MKWKHRRSLNCWPVEYCHLVSLRCVNRSHLHGICSISTDAVHKYRCFFLVCLFVFCLFFFFFFFFFFCFWNSSEEWSLVMEHTLHVLTSRWKRGIDGETLKKKNCPREDLRSQKEPRTVRLKRGRAPSPCWAMATTSAASASTEGHARSRKVTRRAFIALLAN